MIPLFLAVLAAIPAAEAATPADYAWDSWLAGDFNRVVIIAAESGQDTTLAPQIRGKVFLALGCVEAMRGRDLQARSAFATARRLNPELKVAEEDVPPPVWAIYKTIPAPTVLVSGADLPGKPPAEPVRRDTLRIPLPIHRDRLSSAKSLLFPGWGHIAEARSEGYWIVGGETFLAAAWIALAVAADNARDRYMEAASPDRIETEYDRYDTLHRLTWAAGAATVSLYVFSQWDYFSKPPPLSLSIRLDRRDSPMITIGYAKK